jgi:hypothetical protein
VSGRNEDQELERRAGIEPANAGFADLSVSDFATGGPTQRHFALAHEADAVGIAALDPMWPSTGTPFRSLG